MADIIETFKVKPAGIKKLVRWRYKRVLIDRTTYAITNQCVPDKECMNENSIHDYEHVSRAFKQGQLITEFCNLSTFTNVRVYAQDTAPFAYVETDENATECGYETPLPTPAVPPDPFGTPEHGAYKTYEFCNKTDNYHYRIIFYKKNYSGPSSAIAEGGVEPLIYKYSGETKLSPIRGCQAIITLKATPEFNIDELYTDDERQFLVRIFKNDVLDFSGFVIPDLAERPFKSFPYDVQIRVTDGLGLLKNVQFPISTGSRLDVRQRFIDALAFCFSQTGLGLEIYTTCNFYEEKMLNGPDDDPLAQSSVNPLRLSDDRGTLRTCYDALTEICTQFFGFVCQVEGRWHFVRFNELSMESVRRRKYNYTALFLNSDQLAPLVFVGPDENVKLIGADAKLSRNPGFKYVKVFMKYGFVPSLIMNGDFESWDGNNFNYWTAYGGLNFGRQQKYLLGFNGKKVNIEDYAFIFNRKADFGKYVVPSSLPVNPGDKITVTFNYGNQNVVPVPGELFSLDKPIDDTFYEEFYFRMKVGSYYLRNKTVAPESETNTESAFEWDRALSTCMIRLGTGVKNINTYQIQFDIPPVPVARRADPLTNGLIIQIFGFKLFTKLVLPSGRLSTDQEIANAGFTIDNFSLKKTFQYDESQILGVNFKAAQDKYFTASENIETVFGDFDDNTLFRVTASGSRQDNPLEQTLHAIYTADNSFSKMWYDMAGDSEKLPINMQLAKSIMKAHQRASYQLDCNLHGIGLNYLNVFNICGLSGVYQQLSAEFHLKSNKVLNATLVEAFTLPIKTNNDSSPATAKTASTQITSDPMGDAFLQPGDNDDRIFFPQFTNQFI